MLPPMVEQSLALKTAKPAIQPAEAEIMRAI
jgi:hypothetical protein